MITVPREGRRRVPTLDLGSMSSQLAEELDAVWRGVVASSAFVGGAAVGLFEQDWAAYCDRRYAVGVANGTEAIELVVRALEIGPGDEVIVPTNTFVATVEAVVLAGATPRLVDVDPRTLVLRASDVDDAITARTAAVIAVDLHGNLPDMNELTSVADQRGIALIEDAAQAHGARWRGQPAGSFGVASCFSFYPGKNLGAFGDAGAVVTDDAALERRIRSLANHGRADGMPNVHERIGRNSRMDTIQAAVLSVKLSALDGWNDLRRRVAAAYRSQLPPSLVPVEITPGVDSAYHQFVVRVRDRDLVQAALADRDIETGIHYPVPCHKLRPYRASASGPLPAAEAAATQILSLPMFPHLTDREVRAVCGGLADVRADGPTG